MAYDEGVAERLREVFAGQTDIVEKKMFGGMAFMHSGNMCCGVVNDVLMARVGPDSYEDALQKPGILFSPASVSHVGNCSNILFTWCLFSSQVSALAAPLMVASRTY